MSDILGRKRVTFAVWGRCSSENLNHCSLDTNNDIVVMEWGHYMPREHIHRTAIRPIVNRIKRKVLSKPLRGGRFMARVGVLISRQGNIGIDSHVETNRQTDGQTDTERPIERHIYAW